MPKKKAKTEELKKQLQKPVRKHRVLTPDDYLHSGSHMLNLGCTGDAKRGYAKGTASLIAGGTSSGKTWLGHAAFAEACINPIFKDYRLIYDNSENGAFMNIKRFFGQAVLDRIEAPRYDKDGFPQFSYHIEDLFFNVDDALKDGRPFIYVKDSIDATTSDAEEEKFQKNKKAFREDGDRKGDFGDGKAKVASRNFRLIIGGLEKSDSIFIALNQTRDNINANPFEKKETRSGGHAWEFYSHLVFWLKVVGHHKKTVNKKERELGVNTRARIEKSRYTGRMREVTIPIYHSFGIDNTGSMIDYLISEGVWKKSGQKIRATGIGPAIEATKSALIKKIETEGLEEDLVDLVQETWDEIEDACKIERKSRYG